MFNLHSDSTSTPTDKPLSVNVNLGLQSAFHVVNNSTSRSENSTRDIISLGLALQLKQNKNQRLSGISAQQVPRVTCSNSNSSESAAINSFNNCASSAKSRPCDADLIVPSSSSESSPSAVSGLCHICSDRATGKHYGAISCDGCKGFFRRSVRKNHEYACRFSSHCTIDRDKRNTCRYCRYEKCLKAGMKKQAVQMERDRIYVRRKRNITRPVTSTSSEMFVGSPVSSTASKLADLQCELSLVRSEATQADINPQCALEPGDQLEALKQAEHLFANQQQQAVALLAAATSSAPSSATSGADVRATPPTSVSTANDIASPLASCYNHSASLRLASISDLADAIKEQLLLLVDWAKALPPFIDLSLDDQVSLLRAYAAEHLLLGVARRSLPFEDVLLLSNDACIPRHHSSQIHDVNHVVFRILDELVEPMRELQLDDTENGCLKALLFFNPSAFGLVNKNKVKQTRQGFLEAFHEYVTTKRSQNDKVRFGNLLLLLPPLQSMSQQFIEDLQLATLFGISTFDKLLEELLLATASSPFLSDGFSAVAKTMAGNHVIDLTDSSDIMQGGSSVQHEMDRM